MISRVFNRNLLSSVKFTVLKPQAVYKFSEKAWKERDEAA